MLQEPRILDCKGSVGPGQAVSFDGTGQVGAQVLHAGHTGQQPLASKAYGLQALGGLQADGRQESAAAQADAFVGPGAEVQRCSAESQASDGRGQDHVQRQPPLASTVHGQALLVRSGL